MKELTYYLVDVFTETPFEGNQLAVFPDPKDISDNLMQKIANEFNLSETTFVFPSDDDNCDCKVIIYTPQNELPMAGHPTIGTAFTLLQYGLLKPKNLDFLVFEEGVGPVKVEFELKENKPDLIFMNQPIPEFRLKFSEPSQIAELLSLNKEDVRSDIPVQVASSGVPFLFVPLGNINAVKNAKVRIDLLDEVLKDFETNQLFIFTTETERKDSFVHCRMFAPSFGIVEDPATGSAHGPLGAYLVKYGLSDGKRFASEQGFEMGRPSIINVEVKHDGGKIQNVKVGGKCVAMGKGILQIDD
ncbi:MAG: PhzF family phenazine biosynthesis protein [Ignavibacterium sp.]|nr:MAG: PhzF family phenazine biosynthesis protein [Ignavibacterium sp.]